MAARVMSPTALPPRDETARATVGIPRRPIIALVAHNVDDDNGTGRVCAELIRHAVDSYDFIVVSAVLGRELQTLVRQWIAIRVPTQPFGLRFAWFWLRAGRVVNALDADIVHTVGAIVPNSVDIATVHFCHAGFVGNQRRLGPQSAPLLQRCNTAIARVLALCAERWCYRPSRLRAFAAVSNGVQEELLQYYPGVKVHVTPNGVDLERFHPDASARRHLRRSAGLTDEPVAVFIGGDWDRKGLAIGIHALAKVRARGIDLRLWVVGTGDQDRFSSLAEELGVTSAVSFFGTRDDVERFLAAADVFILPSQYETFSLAGFEAAASGLPVVVTRVHGLSDLVKYHSAGLLVERNAESVAGGLGRLAGEPELRWRLGQGALRGARGYSWTVSASATTDLYESLLLEERQDHV
jgi:glycosyltransferase involved in cell wall biosynthesis